MGTKMEFPFSSVAGDNTDGSGGSLGRHQLKAFKVLRGLGSELGAKRVVLQ